MYRQIQQLRRLSIAALRIKYREVFDAEAKIRHKQFLIRRIAWQLQARAQGDLSERARRRIAAIAQPWELSGKEAIDTAPSPQVRKPQFEAGSQRDPRLPAVGTLLRRQYQGREIVVKVLADGFEWDSARYSSLSAVAREVTGTRWNGLLFFGLAERVHG